VCLSLLSRVCLTLPRGAPYVLRATDKDLCAPPPPDDQVNAPITLNTLLYVTLAHSLICALTHCVSVLPLPLPLPLPPSFPLSLPLFLSCAFSSFVFHSLVHSRAHCQVNSRNSPTLRPCEGRSFLSFCTAFFVYFSFAGSIHVQIYMHMCIFRYSYYIYMLKHIYTLTHSLCT